MSEQMPTMPIVDNKEVKPLLPGEGENPKLEVPGETSSEIKIPLVPKAGIKVFATRKGFYAQQRIAVGQKFVVKKFESLGEWMQCEDSSLEKKRVEFFKNKKAKK